MEEVFYIKKGRRYVPVKKYDDKLHDAKPFGAYVTVVSEKSTSHRYGIDPAFGPLIAAGMYAKDKMADVIMKESEFRPINEGEFTAEQKYVFKRLHTSYSIIENC